MSYCTYKGNDRVWKKYHLWQAQQLAIRRDAATSHKQVSKCCFEGTLDTNLTGSTISVHTKWRENELMGLEVISRLEGQKADCCPVVLRIAGLFHVWPSRFQVRSTLPATVFHSTSPRHCKILRLRQWRKRSFTGGAAVRSMGCGSWGPFWACLPSCTSGSATPTPCTDP